MQPSAVETEYLVVMEVEKVREGLRVRSGLFYQRFFRDVRVLSHCHYYNVKRVKSRAKFWPLSGKQQVFAPRLVQIWVIGRCESVAGVNNGLQDLGYSLGECFSRGFLRLTGWLNMPMEVLWKVAVQGCFCAGFATIPCTVDSGSCTDAKKTFLNMMKRYCYEREQRRSTGSKRRHSRVFR